MAALKLDMTIPLGDAGHVSFAADIPDISRLGPAQRQVLADTAREFTDFAAATLAGPRPAAPAAAPAGVHDPGAGILAGVDSGRRGGRA